MEKFILKSLLALSLFSLAACSGVEPTEVSGIDSNVIVSSSFSEYSSEKIHGSGTIRFLDSLTVSSSKSFALKASLDDTIAMSSVSVIMYSANSVMPTNDGIMVTFSRSGASVNAQISYNGNAAMVNTSRLSFYFPTSLDLIVEVHNVNSKARVLVWRRDMVEYAPATADIDTERAGDLNSSLPVQRGAGPYAGLIIQNSTVTAGRLDSQKVLD
ncbi:hypothetical protein [Bdellovibrio bacteriovorus]|uniref:hypothetical protein n=1 Tax=Bdellovibrio bacteriovorus TaxID=959 RepID=UPI0035A98BBD